MNIWWGDADILRRIIRCHAYLYYTLDDPSISDGTYDMLMKRLEKLEQKNPSVIPKNSPTQLVGEAISMIRGSGKTKEEIVKTLKTLTTTLCILHPKKKRRKQ